MRCRFCGPKTALTSVSPTSFPSGFPISIHPPIRSVQIHQLFLDSLLPYYLDRRIYEAEFPTHTNSLFRFHHFQCPVSLYIFLPHAKPPVRQCSHVATVPVSLFAARRRLYARSDLSLGSLLVWDITQCMSVLTDVSGLLSASHCRLKITSHLRQAISQYCKDPI